MGALCPERAKQWSSAFDNALKGLYILGWGACPNLIGADQLTRPCKGANNNYEPLTGAVGEWNGGCTIDRAKALPYVI